ncbi:BOS complex subunit NOMO3 [Battus philenor]|uniref:BOS complex subunit NOMO3 n=1 Tax=Battus philenor TaxID=42288 RepID=UPI0035D0CC1A
MVTLYFNRIKIIFSLLQIILFSLISKCNSNEILGCGGFVKSHVNLDFSKIEIGLYTKEGILKEKTECAPTNGYYFLPMYEHGEYVLKVHPPAGWSFEPSQVELLVNGESDRCSTGQDINFAFNGFGITGRVITAGQTSGPSGITVQLVDDFGGVRDTVTTTGGDFHFTPVIPGKYTVKATHPKWKLEPGQAVVQVKEGNTVLPTGVLAVKGYEVTGSITSFGSPIGGIHVLLYSKEDKQQLRVEGCKTALLQGVPDSPICYSVTDTSGEFQFGLVPAGEYKLLALSKPPGQAIISYNIKPESVPFSVKHDNLYIKNAFEVTGFTVVGSVVNAPGGDGISGVRVLSDGIPIGTTDASGKFTLASLRPGVYTLSFQHEQCELEDLQLSVVATGPANSARVAAARWRVCGDVSPPEQRRVLLAAKDSAPVHVTPKPDGTWCTFLSPGTYTAKVEVSEEELRDGLQWYPASRTVTVARGSVAGVGFSQVRARVRGRVRTTHAAHAQELRVRLRALAPDGGYIARSGDLTVTPDPKGEYEFRDVVPGSVEVSVEGARLCWVEARHNVAVASELALVPAFEQAGYLLHLASDYDIEVEFKSRSSEGVLKVPAGESQQCVPTSEVYTLVPRGCHRFEPHQAIVDIAAETHPSVQFRAVAHAAVVRVTSPEPAEDLVLHVSTEAGGARDVGPLLPVPDPAHGYVYEHTLYLADGESALVSGSSSSLVVRPAGGRRVRALPVCAPGAPPALVLRAARALTLSGHVHPPVADVRITLRSDDLQMTQVTLADGAYRFGPLDAAKTYTVTAEKESYVFGERDEDGNIPAHKLAEIHVELVDASDGSPLEGALVSVSGGEYRRTAGTGADGRLRFAALSPAHYYVRPHLKEYRLDPPHATVHVPPYQHSDQYEHQPSVDHTLRFSGVRVAWSVSGRAVSLGGAGVAGAGVRAQPLPDASAQCVPQDATAAQDATFRIRGLIPNCSYKIELKESSSPELGGLRLAKAPPVIEMKERDVEGIRLVVVQRQRLTDGSVLLKAHPDHYRTLRLTLAPERTPHAPLMTVRPDAGGCSVHSNPGHMYTLPRLQPDNTTYVLRLESTLSKATHSYEEQTIYFNSDGRYKHFNIEFTPKVRASEQELRATSILIVPLLGALVLAVSRRDYVTRAFAAAAAATVATATTAATTRRTTRKKAQ